MYRRHTAKGRTRHSDQFVCLYHWQLNSLAWRSLTPQAIAVYLAIESRYYGSNNGRISLSVREAAKLCHIAPRTASRALQELQDKGFIVMTVKGDFKMKSRHATLWRLTRAPYNDENATKDFMRWQPNERNSSVSKYSPTVSKCAQSDSQSTH